MSSLSKHLNQHGYAIASGIYSNEEIGAIIEHIESKTLEASTVSKTQDVFAIRQLFKTLPELHALVFNENLKEVLSDLGDDSYFISKAIYFDKPKQSNWFVAYHQDLSISVTEKVPTEEFKNWTFKKGQHSVQPPTAILQDTFTIRIHLDTTTKENGALRVIPSSHKQGIIRIDHNKIDTTNQIDCEVEKGGIMLMKPLTLHASSRTTNNQQRRVIHIEFCNKILPKPLDWLEYGEI